FSAYDEGFGTNVDGGVFVEDYNCQLVTNTMEQDNPASESTLYPNPNQGYFTLSLTNPPVQYEVEIYNLLGEKIYAASLTGNKTELNLVDKPAGIYFYRLLSMGGSPISGKKFIIQ
ncbi:MAG TPA: T9SS type A sorting domain-containing protein, partial [Bacteroidia bacterium]|nr:T9SS type A sorting domain-containing protein [Bacteroidia bacterium]